MPSHYVLIDFENIQPASLAALAGTDITALIFVGASQAKGRISFELSRSVQQLGASAEYVTIARNGPNAVDMHIAYYVGTLLQRDAETAIHIVSADSDFDPLFEFLRARGYLVQRTKSIGDVVERAGAKGSVRSGKQPSRSQGAAVAAAPVADASEPIVKLLRSLSGKPATRKKLGQTILSFLQDQRRVVSNSTAAEIIDRLIQRQLVSLNGAQVVYHLD